MTRLPSEPGDPQSGLFDDGNAYARGSDPGTAQEAAQVMTTSGKAESLNQMIRDDLERLGVTGITSWEFSRDHPDAERVSVSPRFSDLYKRRIIGKRGQRRRPGQSGGAPSSIYVLPMHSNEMFGRHDEDDDPKPNSPEDLGLGPHSRPPESKAYGKRSPGPDPIPHNVATGTIQFDDAKKFVTWLHDQDLPIHEDVTVGHVLVALSGLGVSELRWLCQGIRQAEKVPQPALMKLAAMKRDVAFLRLDKYPEPEKTRRR